MHPTRRPFLAALLLGALVAPSVAQTLTGHIVDYNGAPVFNVNVILSNGAPLGTTDAAGNFTITGLRNRLYTIQLDPHSNLLDAQQFDFTVSGAANLGTVVLQRAWQVSAQFIGPTGAPLFGVNMNTYLMDGTKLYTPHDGTDVFGYVDIGAPANAQVRIRGVPPVGSGLVPFEQIMTLTASVNLGTITLRQGYPVTGTVTDKINNLPIAGAQIVTTNMLTGEVVVQINKLTNAVGAFNVVVPFGLYQVEIIQPLGNLHAAKQLLGLPIITAGYNLGLIGLERGFTVTGTVLSPSGPVGNSDTDMFTADGYKLYTPNDNTNAAGVFSVVIPAGTYQFRVDPQVIYGVVGARTANITISANTALPTVNLAAGVPLTLNVTDFNGAPVGNANLNFADPTTGAQVIIAGDFADATGHINAIVPMGTWNMTIQAPQGSLAHAVAFPNTVITGPLTQNIVMPRKQLMMDLKTITSSSILSIPNGGILPIDWTFQNPDVVNHPAIIDGGVVLPDGTYVPWVPLIGLDFLAGTGITLQFQLPMPPLPANQLDRMQKFVVRFHDPLTFAILEQAYINYVPL